MDIISKASVLKKPHAMDPRTIKVFLIFSWKRHALGSRLLTIRINIPRKMRNWKTFFKLSSRWRGFNLGLRNVEGKPERVFTAGPVYILRNNETSSVYSIPDTEMFISRNFFMKSGRRYKKTAFLSRLLLDESKTGLFNFCQMSGARSGR